jgi:hypothetical protein
MQQKLLMYKLGVKTKQPHVRMAGFNPKATAVSQHTTSSLIPQEVGLSAADAANRTSVTASNSIAMQCLPLLRSFHHTPLAARPNMHVI